MLKAQNEGLIKQNKELQAENRELKRKIEKPIPNNNYERIKRMTVDEMAKQLTQLQCAECGAHDGYEWKNCQLVGCWCHPNNGYQSYAQWLLAEVEG